MIEYVSTLALPQLKEFFNEFGFVWGRDLSDNDLKLQVFDLLRKLKLCDSLTIKDDNYKYIFGSDISENRVQHKMGLL